jgi:hypothetical protein
MNVMFKMQGKIILIRRIALGRTDSDQRKDNLFLSELKHITKLIQENDFKAELEDRIRRV